MNLPEAMFQLGLMIQDGDTGPKDDAVAKALFEKAAALGPTRWSGSAPMPLPAAPDQKTSKAAIGFYKQAAALGSEDAAAALKRLRCPYVLKNKDGMHTGNLCFDGKN